MTRPMWMAVGVLLWGLLAVVAILHALDGHWEDDLIVGSVALVGLLFIRWRAR